MHVTVDDVAISPPEGFLVRKGPGHCHFDFAQEILFIDYLQASDSSTQANRYSSALTGEDRSSLSYTNTVIRHAHSNTVLLVK